MIWIDPRDRKDWRIVVASSDSTGRTSLMLRHPSEHHRTRESYRIAMPPDRSAAELDDQLLMDLVDQAKRQFSLW